MSGRKECLYQAIYLKLKELSPTFQPQVVMADYETAIGNATKEVFPAVRITGCRFHYGQALLRKLKAVGLQTEYINDPQIKKCDQKLIAMCLLPADLVQEEVDKLKLKEEAWRHSDPQIREKMKKVREKMKKFVLYYDRFWMEQKNPELFSVHGHCTSNVSIALHSKMSKSMMTHPGFWRFFEELQRHVS